MKVLVTGFNTIDYIFSLSSPFRPDGKVHAESYQTFGGGQAANVAFTFAGLGAGVHYAGVFGDDPGGQLARHTLELAGVDLSSSVILPDCPNHQAVVINEPASGTRSVVQYKDPRLSPEPALLHAGLFESVDLFYTDNHEPGISAKGLEIARRINIKTGADLEVLNPEVIALIPGIDYLIAPLGILQTLSGASEPQQVLISLIERFSFEILVATDGVNGSFSLLDGQLLHVSAEQTPVTDTTGAGDAYHAAFLYAISHQKPLREAMQFASHIAALKVGTAGPRPALHDLQLAKF